MKSDPQKAVDQPRQVGTPLDEEVLLGVTSPSKTFNTFTSERSVFVAQRHSHDFDDALFFFFSLQLFWEKKLSGLNAYDIAEELVKTMELPKGLQGNRVYV